MIDGASKERTRRYYLHRKMKDIMRVNAYSRTLYYRDEIIGQMSYRHIRYFVELLRKFHYSAQQEI